MWTHFWDMHSGGDLKEDFAHCYIEAPEEQAKIVFQNRFGHNPERVTCTCCGEDYSISSGEDLAQLTGFHRRCRWDKETEKYIEEEDNKGLGRTYMTLDEYMQQPDVKIIPLPAIRKEDFAGELKPQGYVWMG